LSTACSKGGGQLISNSELTEINQSITFSDQT
jgi:hypothetical protein